MSVWGVELLRSMRSIKKVICIWFHRFDGEEGTDGQYEGVDHPLNMMKSC